MIEIENNWSLLGGMSLLLASVHIWFPWFDNRMYRRESFWMGLIGGIATCYVVLYLMPKIGWITVDIVGPDRSEALSFLDLRMYYLLLASIVVYLLMIHLDQAATRMASLASAFDYIVHGIYSLLLGYVFVEVSSPLPMPNLLIVSILALHLMGMNHLLRSIRRPGFDRAARWLFFLLLLTGSALALTTELPKGTINSITAFLAGIILVNVISEELPLKDVKRMPWFLAGIALYVLVFFVVIILDPRPVY